VDLGDKSDGNNGDILRTVIPRREAGVRKK
jgi:hypothetical protein